jgi:8-oxo-dGTP pyrophosphatase MutT (NUDIX family)
VSRGDHLPQQAATIAFRRIGESVQVCLIRRKDSEAWAIPKGLVDPGSTPEETALNEAWEEAGLRGRLTGDSIGSYKYEKWGATFTVAVYLMQVLDQRNRWQEASFRERRWTSLNDAILLLSDHPVRPLLDRAISVLAVAPDSPSSSSRRADRSG